jgi:ABC-type multidrug transport system permease subunit
MFTVLFPITFLANTFAPTEPMPRWLRVMAEWNPVSSLAQAMRELWGNGPPAPPDAQLPLHYPVLATVAWALAMTAVLAPFALRAYARRNGGDIELTDTASGTGLRAILRLPLAPRIPPSPSGRGRG